MAKKIGKRTIELENKPNIISYGSAVGEKEHEGPLSDEFDFYTVDSFFGEKSFEKAESKLQKTAINIALEKAGLKPYDIDKIFAGDLLNQCIGSAFGIRDFGIPFLGLYGACSTMALSTGLASLFVECGAADRAFAVTSSHFCSAERQYRFPPDHGSHRTPPAQWTVTGSGALILENSQKGPFIDKVTFGEIEDYGVTDINNMGAAMAPAAASTLKHFFEDTETVPKDYDIIFTGDLGFIGTQCLYDLCDREGIDIKCRHTDCGNIIFDRERQDVHGGGSGCGCSASVLCSYVMHHFESGDFNNILFLSTGALMSPTSSFQGESIPGIAHLLNIRSTEEK